MHSYTLKTLALVSGLGLLSACPNETTTETETGTSGSSSTGGDPSSDPTGPSEPTTTTNTTPPDPTTTSPTEPTTGTDTTVDPTTEGDPTTDSTTGTVDNLCSRLGGMAADGIPALVDGFIGELLTDEKINGYFLNSDVNPDLKGCIVDQLGQLAECAGVMYTCKDMVEAHAGLGISQIDFDDFVVDFVAAYDEHAAAHPELTDADKSAIADALAGMAGQIIEDPENNLTVYQRVGRKPAIKTLIGHPGEPATFVDNVAMNPALVVFFAMTDFDRLNTCLTRQVASIDGPVEYGLEVTAPDGIDPGVSLDNPCKDMKTVHAGLMDDMMMGVTIDDFMALVDELIKALDSAGVAEEDKNTILAVLGPMCDDIVAEPNTCPGNAKTELIEALDLALPIDNMVVNGKWDDKYNGKIESMLCVDIVVADDGINFVDDVRLKIGMDHSYVGDITIKVVSPDAKLLTALGRPGKEMIPLADNGVACCGDDSNLSAANPFTLSNTATISGKDMGLNLSNIQTICKDENPKIDPCMFKPYKGGGPGNDFSDFKGISPVGTWKVCIGDSGTGDFGTLQYIGLILDKVKFAP